MLYAGGNDSNLEVLGLITEDGAYITDAQLTCAISDPTGNPVATVTLAYLGTGVAVGGHPDGNYRGTLPGATALVAGTTYTLAFAAGNYGFSEVRYEVAQARTG